jgi:hypothetical protein
MATGGPHAGAFLAVLPEHDGTTAVVPVEMGDIGLEERDGVEAKAVACFSSCAARWRSCPTSTVRPKSSPSPSPFLLFALLLFGIFPSSWFDEGVDCETALLTATFAAVAVVLTVAVAATAFAAEGVGPGGRSGSGRCSSLSTALRFSSWTLCLPRSG